MKAADNDRAEMLKESRRLIKNISRRVKRIEGLGDTAPQTAVRKFKDATQELPRYISKLSDEDLSTLHRDLRYIDSLKSSRVKTALKSKGNMSELQDKAQVQGDFESLRDLINSLPENTRDAVWSAYDRFYDYTGSGEKFKYEVIGAAIDYLYLGQDKEKVAMDIIKYFEETYKELGSHATDEKVKVLFTSKLQSFLK